MITEEQYLEAKKIVDAYKLQFKQARVINSVCDCCVPRPEEPFEYDNTICEKCGFPIKQNDTLGSKPKPKIKKKVIDLETWTRWNEIIKNI